MGSLLADVVRAAVTGEQPEVGAAEFTGGIQDMCERSTMMQASDDRAIGLAWEAGLNNSSAAEVWKERFRLSPALRAEFGAVEHYVGYMNAKLTKWKASRPPLTQTEMRSAASLDTDEANAVGQVKVRGLDKSERSAIWVERWSKTPALHAEFVTADTYAAYMNAAVEGRVKIMRGVVKGRADP
jgi:hypothetical protein